MRIHPGKSRTRAAAALLLCTLLGGCDSALPATWGPVIDVPVENPAENTVVIGADKLEAAGVLPPSLVLRVGEEEDGPHNFSFIKDIVFAGAGEVLVLDQNALHIVAADGSSVLLERPDLGPGYPRFGPGREDSSVWDIITLTGTLQGRITFPEGFEPYDVRDGVVAGVQTSIDDVQSLVLYRVMPASDVGQRAVVNRNQ